MARDAILVFQNKRKIVNAQITSVLALASQELSTRIKIRHLGGSKTTSDRLRTQSGTLERSIVVDPPSVKGNLITSKVRITAPYSSVHFGQKGTSTTISAKSSPNLAIPTNFARDSRGVPLGPVDSPAFTPLFTTKGKIFGRVQGQQGIVPLFTLKKQVTVPVRIDIKEDLLDPTQIKVEKRLADVLLDF